jgi:8-oxo-dGTP pyrophosphatase MutT (NUDIX family)
MTASNLYPTVLFSDEFVESAGVVLFDLTTHRICLLEVKGSREYVLPKGRRNIGESRREAALREVLEETGYNCRILSVNMTTRTPPKDESTVYSDEARRFENIEEPFALTQRQLGERNLKLIWWFIATIDKPDESKTTYSSELKFQVTFLPYEAAVTALTYEVDRMTVRKAIELVQGTYYRDSAKIDESMYGGI